MGRRVPSRLKVLALLKKSDYVDRLDVVLSHQAEAQSHLFRDCDIRNWAER
jgi:hypothetical protein